MVAKTNKTRIMFTQIRILICIILKIITIDRLQSKTANIPPNDTIRTYLVNLTDNLVVPNKTNNRNTTHEYARTHTHTTPVVHHGSRKYYYT